MGLFVEVEMTKEEFEGVDMFLRAVDGHLDLLLILSQHDEY